MTMPSPLTPDPMPGPPGPLPDGQRGRGGRFRQRARNLWPRRKFLTRIFKR